MINITDNDLNELYDWAVNQDEGGTSHYPGMSYEDGIKAVIDWIEGNTDRPDLED